MADVKQKSPTRLRSDLWNKLRPEVDVQTLVNEIKEFLDKHVSKTARKVSVANNLAAYLTQKYSLSNRKAGNLRNLIECHAEDLAGYLDQIRFKEYQFLLKNVNQLPRPKKKTRARPKTEAEREQGVKSAKNRHEQFRRAYREGLIEEQFGKPQITTLDPNLSSRPTGPCLDILFRGKGVKMCGDWDSLENLFGVDRHRFPKSLRRKDSRRNEGYDLGAFVKCLIYLLENRRSGQQWLPEPRQRELVLRGIIKRAHRFSSEGADMLAGKLRPYLS